MPGFARFAECYSPTAAPANGRKGGDWRKSGLHLTQFTISGARRLNHLFTGHPYMFTFGEHVGGVHRLVNNDLVCFQKPFTCEHPLDTSFQRKRGSEAADTQVFT
jgi:hypothetical protein